MYSALSRITWSLSGRWNQKFSMSGFLLLGADRYLRWRGNNRLFPSFSEGWTAFLSASDFSWRRGNDGGRGDVILSRASIVATSYWYRIRDRGIVSPEEVGTEKE